MVGMKFTINSSVLAKQLTAINGVIVSNPIVPILENFLFDIKDGKLTITASDLQTSIITELAIESPGEAQIAVPARILLETLKNLPEQPISFTIDERAYSVMLSSVNGQYSLAGENATDFPQVAKVQEIVVFNVAAGVLKQAINQTIIATSHDEMRPAMSGVYVDINEEGLQFVATDGHRLVRYIRTDIQGSNQHSFIIPRKTLSLLNGLLPNDDQVVEIIFGDSNVHFKLGKFVMISRLIDERYPDYENVIPKVNPNQLIINRPALVASLKRIAIYANRTSHQVKLVLGDHKLGILAEDLDFANKANEELSCEYEGKPLEIGFNAKLVIEMLNSLSAEDIVIHLSEPNRAAVIVPVEKAVEEDILLLVMPVILQ
jgi:DNA polymerase III subunit beta